MSNPFVHVELNTVDTAKAKKFYKSLFDWKLTDTPMTEGTYTMIDVGKGTGGGIMKQLMPNQPSFWVSYVQVDDVKKTMKKAKTLGAIVHVDYKEIPGMGALGMFTDPTGAILAVWKPAEQMRQPKAAKAKPRKR